MLAQSLCEGKLILVGAADEDGQFRIHDFFSKKVKVFPLSFQKPIIVCISEERKRGKLSYCLWECCSSVIPMEIYPICVINTVKPCLTELGQHMLSWDYFRLSKAFALLFSKNLSLTHSIFSHGKHYYYYRLCLLTVWMSHLFIWFITNKLALGPWLPWEGIRWEPVTTKVDSCYFISGLLIWILTMQNLHQKFCTLHKHKRPCIQI